jgi:hypothetical protein
MLDSGAAGLKLLLIGLGSGDDPTFDDERLGLS